MTNNYPQDAPLVCFFCGSATLPLQALSVGKGVVDAWGHDRCAVDAGWGERTGMREELLELAERCAWPRFEVPGQRTPHDARSWRAFVDRANPKVLVEVSERLRSAAETNAVTIHGMLFDEP